MFKLKESFSSTCSLNLLSLIILLFLFDTSLAQNNSMSFGGVVSGTTKEICFGQSIGTLNLTKQRGTIITWQENFNNEGWTNIPVTENQTSYTEIPGSFGYWSYRVVIKNDSSFEFSNTWSISVQEQSYGGNLMIDNDGLGSEISFSLFNHNGSIIKWQKSHNNGIWHDISNTSVSYNFKSILGGNYSFRVITNTTKVCLPDTSNQVDLFIDSSYRLENRFHK